MPIDAPTMDVLRKQAIAMAMLWFTAGDYRTDGGHAWFHIRARDLGLKDSVLPGMKIAVRIECEPDPSGVSAVCPMHDAKAERERFEAAYADIPPIRPTKETAWRIWNMARAYGLIAASGVGGNEHQPSSPSTTDGAPK